MRKLHYCLVDVFTDRAFGGNQLAVFPDGRNITASEMQAIAKELNLSETVFVLPPEDPAHTYRLRIFSPALELPLAGHPTVGTAFVLAHQGLVQLDGSEKSIIFEEGVGPIPVTYHMQAGSIQSIQMLQPRPSFGPLFTEPAAIAEMLSLNRDELDLSLPLEVVSCGVPFLFAPIKTLAAMRAIRFRRDVWDRVLQDFVAPHIFTFTREVENPGSTVHSRMFAPAMGIAEDPATGAASGPLGCYLVRHGLVSSDDSAGIVSEQGIEMGRPSFIQINIQHTGQDITGVYVGGQSYFMGEGFIELA